MTLRDGDTLYPHHPTTVPAGDYAVNSRPGDVWYLVVDEDQYGTAWDILNEFIQATSWHIHPATIEFIAQFVIKYIRTAYNVKNNITEFSVCPIDTGYEVATVLDDTITMKEYAGETAFFIKDLQTNFEMKHTLKTNFAITRVFDNTRSEL